MKDSFFTKAAEDAIRAFPFWDYGLDDTDPKSPYAEWVTPLAEAVVAAVERAYRIEAGGQLRDIMGQR